MYIRLGRYTATNDINFEYDANKPPVWVRYILGLTFIRWR